MTNASNASQRQQTAARRRQARQQRNGRRSAPSTAGSRFSVVAPSSVGTSISRKSAAVPGLTAGKLAHMEKMMAQLAAQRSAPTVGTVQRVASTHHMPPHKMYDPELGMATFAYRAVGRKTVVPHDATANAGVFVFDASGVSLSSNPPLPETASQILFSFTPSNGNFTPLQILLDGNESSTNTTTGWENKALWDTIPLLPDMSNITDQHRVVNASLKITYTGNSLANSGVVYVYQGPHIPVYRSALTGAAKVKLSVHDMVQRIRNHPKTRVYDTACFRGGKIFHIERGSGRRNFVTPYKARAPVATGNNHHWPTDPEANPAMAGTTTTAEGTFSSGFPRYLLPPTMQAMYVFAEGVSVSGANFTLEVVQHAEIQIDPDATSHVGLQTPPNNSKPEVHSGGVTTGHGEGAGAGTNGAAGPSS